ncbi:hypothetical protein QTH87_16475 [Variovorax sp. J22P168]|uniref:hypothetical protein n=1 Tax=Variovorax jilinensis TaxID=3053513 RepID=UPI0025773949|nr:hypothetical protein [Variovorax sp. J22P168]MDM0014033.1 hypothetical protein [Variovorax sp. J22P168]
MSAGWGPARDAPARSDGQRLPDDAILRVDSHGCLATANAAAQRLWGHHPDELLGQPVQPLLDGLGLRWRDGGEALRLSEASEPIAGEAEDECGRRLLLRCLPLPHGIGAAGGHWLVVTDLTALRQAERQRDEALRFLAHDGRQPGAAILGMLELARERPAAFPDDSLQAAIAHEARDGLDRCERFVATARAETRPLHVEPLDLGATLQLVVDAAWAAARERRVAVRCIAPQADAPCMADRGLMTRALGELLDTGILHSTTGSTLRCGVSHEKGARWGVWFEAMPAAAAAALESRLVRSVALRHGGSLETAPAADGSTVVVTLLLPRTVPQEP